MNREQQLEEDASKIFAIISHTSITLRGDLLVLIGDKLTQDGQFRTGKLLTRAGEGYGDGVSKL